MENFVKKRALALFLVLAFALSITAFAAESRAQIVRPSLTFTGNVAHCALTVSEIGASITATLELYCGGTRLQTWNGSGTSYVSIGGDHTVTTGETYLLIARGTVNGTSFYETVTGTC
ncbi:MAG: hypothetical protein PUB32_08620 [Clostridiales bacterium]|nr:hypothetical protein [Clostridiales bacterium]